MNALFEYEQYMPHGMCLLWEPWLVILWAGSDLLIFLAYMAIPLALIMVLRKRPDIRHRSLVGLFAAFILLCGVTHAMSIVTLWTAIYPLMGTIKLMTGLTSIATAVVLFRLVPAAVRIPTPEKHEEVISQLRVTLDELTEARNRLEERVQERTNDLKNANLRLAFTVRDAVQRSRNLIQVVSSLTQPGVDASKAPEVFLRQLRGRINALTIATTTIVESGNHSTAQLERVIRRQVEPLFAKPGQQLHVDGPIVEVGAQGAQQISLVMWELASRLAKGASAGFIGPVVKISWSLGAPEDKQTHLSLEWRESAKREGIQLLGETEEAPAYQPAEFGEFATALLTQIVPKMLGGTGTIERDAHALVYRLECPLGALTDDDDPKRVGDPTDGDIEAELLAGV